MIKHDYRFDSRLFSSFIGKIFNKYKHQKFLYTNTVTMFLGFMIDDKSFKMSNDFEAVDYMGIEDEATICRISNEDWYDILNDQKDVIETQVNQEIKKIALINDHFSAYSNNKQEYDWWETRAVIFNFGEFELSFEKQDSYFSMEIEVNKGYDLISKISDGKFILKDFEQSPEKTIKVDREIVELK